MDYPLTLRIVVVSPPEGYYYWLADDKGNAVSMTLSTGADIAFDFDGVVKENRKTGAPNFTSPFAAGSPPKRFIYVNIGGSPGQMERRAKIWFSDVNWSTIQKASGKPDRVLMARFMGTSERGGPNCATCELLDGGWVVAER